MQINFQFNYFRHSFLGIKLLKYHQSVGHLTIILMTNQNLNNFSWNWFSKAVYNYTLYPAKKFNLFGLFFVKILNLCTIILWDHFEKSQFLRPKICNKKCKKSDAQRMRFRFSVFTENSSPTSMNEIGSSYSNCARARIRFWNTLLELKL